MVRNAPLIVNIHRRSSTRTRGSTTAGLPPTRGTGSSARKPRGGKSMPPPLYTSLGHLGPAAIYKRVEAASRSRQQHDGILLGKEEPRRLVVHSGSQVGVALSSGIPVAPFSRHRCTMTRASSENPWMQYAEHKDRGQLSVRRGALFPAGAQNNCYSSTVRSRTANGIQYSLKHKHSHKSSRCYCTKHLVLSALLGEGLVLHN